MKKMPYTFVIASLLLSACALNQSSGSNASTAIELPGKLDRARISGGSYSVDSNHTLVTWSLNRAGFNKYTGQFAQATGKLMLNPDNPSAAMVDITLPMSGIVTGAEGLTNRLKTPDFFNADVFPSARFVSTSVVPTGANTAAITGNLTIRDTTRPIILNATFIGAGISPKENVENVGFHATASLKRSEFGIVYILPAIGDDIDLDISVTFMK